MVVSPRCDTRSLVLGFSSFYKSDASAICPDPPGRGGLSRLLLGHRSPCAVPYRSARGEVGPRFSPQVCPVLDPVEGHLRVSARPVAPPHQERAGRAGGSCLRGDRSGAGRDPRPHGRREPIRDGPLAVLSPDPAPLLSGTRPRSARRSRIDSATIARAVSRAHEHPLSARRGSPATCEGWPPAPASAPCVSAWGTHASIGREARAERPEASSGRPGAPWSCAGSSRQYRTARFRSGF